MFNYFLPFVSPARSYILLGGIFFCKLSLNRPCSLNLSVSGRQLRIFHHLSLLWHFIGSHLFWLLLWWWLLLNLLFLWTLRWSSHRALFYPYNSWWRWRSKIKTLCIWQHLHLVFLLRFTYRGVPDLIHNQLCTYGYEIKIWHWENLIALLTLLIYPLLYFIFWRREL